jgi:hypothetical protein
MSVSIVFDDYFEVFRGTKILCFFGMAKEKIRFCIYPARRFHITPHILRYACMYGVIEIDDDRLSARFGRLGVAVLVAGEQR